MTHQMGRHTPRDVRAQALLSLTARPARSSRLVTALGLVAALLTVPACGPAIAAAGSGIHPANAVASLSARTTLVVTTTADVAPPRAPTAYSLRCALTQADTDGAGDVIAFAIPSSDPGCAGSPPLCTITPTSTLPALTASHTIINGYTQPGARPNTNAIGAGDNAILTIRIDESNDVAGLGLNGSASYNTVEGLEIVNYNQADGAYGFALAQPQDHNRIAGNFFGTDGHQALPDEVGIYVENGSSHNTIGGTTPAAVNLISGNTIAGIEIGLGRGNIVEGNYIGTDATGHQALPNGALAHRPSLGAGTAGSPRIPAGLPNAFAGIVVFATAADNIVGGTALTQTNIIDYNPYGVVLAGNSPGSPVTNNTVVGNVIEFGGTGVLAEDDETGDHITANVIANNTGVGVAVGTSITDAVHVSISQNAMDGNGGLGIDLGSVAPTITCTGPQRGAPNDDLPCPVITSAAPQLVTGTACAGCTVEVFIATNEPVAQGHGEGQTYLGSAVASTTGTWSLATTPIVPGTYLTATASRSGRAGLFETSEFGANVSVAQTREGQE